MGPGSHCSTLLQLPREGEEITVLRKDRLKSGIAIKMES
jgi:hypothetical protein